MKNALKPLITRIGHKIFLWTLLLALTAAALSAADQDTLTPSADQSKTLGTVIKRLGRYHYRRLTIDDDLSSRLFDRYLAYIDPSRIYLLASDVEEFEPFRFTLDDALRRGDLDVAFKIFVRLQNRRIDRMEYLVRAVENDLDSLRFDVDDELELDREKTPWIESREEWDDLWRKQFKNDVLNMKLAERSMEDIKEVLTRRYEDRLHRTKQIKSEDVFRTYMDIFTQSYDPHTEYFPPRRAENFDISMSLSYEGIGALLGADGEYIKIQRIIPAGPAEKGGELQAGDRIVGVGQGEEGELVDVIGWRVDEVVGLIRGPKGTVVRLNILPANQPDSGSTRVVELTRNEVKLEEQAAQRTVLEIERGGEKRKIGVVELPAFYIDFKAARAGDPNYKSATRDVARLIEELKAEEVDGIVVDLRGNGGGSLVEAGELTGLFLGEGPIVQIRDPRGRSQVMENPEPEAAFPGPLVVMVDRLSASASEIFAGAVQDYGRGIVVGSRTFGKGTVQSLMPLGDGQLKYTQAKFYRISGGSTQSRGVLPDIPFPSVYDPDEIGESALEESLPWDKIDPAEYERIDDIRDDLPGLLELHEKRIAENPEFTYFIDRLAYVQAARNRTRVSLNEAVRRREREEMEARLLDIENKRREAKGEEPVESFDDLSEEGEEDEPADPEDEVDPFIREAAEILVDFIHNRIGNG